MLLLRICHVSDAKTRKSMTHRSIDRSRTNRLQPTAVIDLRLFLPVHRTTSLLRTSSKPTDRLPRNLTIAQARSCCTYLNTFSDLSRRESTPGVWNSAPTDFPPRRPGTRRRIQRTKRRIYRTKRRIYRTDRLVVDVARNRRTVSAACAVRSVSARALAGAGPGGGGRRPVPPAAARGRRPTVRRRRASSASWWCSSAPAACCRTRRGSPRGRSSSSTTGPSSPHLRADEVHEKTQVSSFRSYPRFPSFDCPKIESGL